MNGTDALVALLGAESFLLAVMAASVALVGREATTSFPLGVEMIAYGAAALTFVLAVGAGAAWCQIYWGGQVRPTGEAIIAASLAIAILAQPILAGCVAWALKSDD